MFVLKQRFVPRKMQHLKTAKFSIININRRTIFFKSKFKTHFSYRFLSKIFLSSRITIIIIIIDVISISLSRIYAHNTIFHVGCGWLLLLLAILPFFFQSELKVVTQLKWWRQLYEMTYVRASSKNSILQMDTATSTQRSKLACCTPAAFSCCFDFLSASTHTRVMQLKPKTIQKKNCKLPS